MQQIIKTKAFRVRPILNRKDYNYDFADYVWFNQFFTEAEVSQIRELWDLSKTKEAEVNQAGHAQEKQDLRKSQVMFIELDAQNEWIYNRLGEACIQINAKRYLFEISGFQTPLQLANYEENGFFDWHMDFGAGDISNRKLSITVQLSDETEYEGGELQFMINQNIVTAPKTKGTAIIFPSFALHRVLPVTKGARKSVVGWIAGPPYK